MSRKAVFQVVFTCLFCTIVIMVLPMIDFPDRIVSAQVVFTIRPIYETDVVLVGNPVHARDTNEFSAAGGAWGRMCKIDCETPVVATATWQRIPGGYRPLALEVKWTLASNMALYGSDTAEVKGTLEYNLGSGWSSWKEYTWTAGSPPCPNPSNGGITCADHVDTLPLLPTQRTDTIQVRVSESIRLTHCDNCWLRVSSAGGSLSVFDIRVKADECYLPTGETTVGVDWSPVIPTAHRFRQTLIPETAGLVFDGRRVTEQDPGGGGPDTCFYLGGPYPTPAISISGGTWLVNSGNVWLYDTVGWLPEVVNTIRAAGHAPCQTTIPQQMVIDCGSVNVIYTTNTLRMGFDDLIVWSERAGVYQQRVWP